MVGDLLSEDGELVALGADRGADRGVVVAGGRGHRGRAVGEDLHHGRRWQVVAEPTTALPGRVRVGRDRTNAIQDKRVTSCEHEVHRQHHLAGDDQGRAVGHLVQRHTLGPADGVLQRDQGGVGVAGAHRVERLGDARDRFEPGLSRHRQGAQCLLGEGPLRSEVDVASGRRAGHADQRTAEATGVDVNGLRARRT